MPRGMSVDLSPSAWYALSRAVAAGGAPGDVVCQSVCREDISVSLSVAATLAATVSTFPGVSEQGTLLCTCAASLCVGLAAHAAWGGARPPVQLRRFDPSWRS
ncbi:hypothetical protein EON62_04685 [archaeon]|nr:MAG: hypothetical protein EON62_04685 [archaeon]